MLKPYKTSLNIINQQFSQVSPRNVHIFPGFLLGVPTFCTAQRISGVHNGTAPERSPASYRDVGDFMGIDGGSLGFYEFYGVNTLR
jgi:hypothetical protein